MNDLEKKMLDELRKKETSSKLNYDEDLDVSETKIPDWINHDSNSDGNNIKEPVKSLGKASFVNRDPLGIGGYWKNIPLENLPSEGFGYPEGMEIAIRPAGVSEIKYYSIIDENDRLDMDDKLNHILSKCTTIKWAGGPLSHYDLHYEDRFYVIMAIRDYTFPKGENRIFLQTRKNCKDEKCDIPDSIELKSNLLDSFKLSKEIVSKFSHEKMCFDLIPKEGGPGVELFIPSVGVTTIVRKIIAEKKAKGKKYDLSFAEISPYIIPNWRDLDEYTYDTYERASNDWDVIQFSIADQVSKMIKFSTKADIRFNCQNCGGEVTAPLTFRYGYRSFFVISDIIGQLL